jgi:hypothetical protein
MGGMSRRGVLGRLGIALTGAGALVAVGTPAEATTATGRRSKGGHDHPLVLAANGLRYLGAAARKPGDSTAFRANVTDAHGKTQLGELLVTTTRIAGAYGDAEELAWIETQLFSLCNGTVSATGTVTQGGRGTFVINGGTGAYSGVRGTYVSQQTVDFSGGGTATFTFSTTTTSSS